MVNLRLLLRCSFEDHTQFGAKYQKVMLSQAIAHWYLVGLILTERRVEKLEGSVVRTVPLQIRQAAYKIQSVTKAADVS